MTIYQLGDRRPVIADECFIADEATLVGDVVVGEQANIWFGAVLRGDNERISVGPRSSIQDAVVMHTDPGYPLTVGSDVTVGHQATLHGCTIEDGALIGMQAIVLNGAVIGENCLLGAGALVSENKTFPPGSLILGAPARVARPLTEDEIMNLKDIAGRYVKRSEIYREELVRL